MKKNILISTLLLVTGIVVFLSFNPTKIETALKEVENNRVDFEGKTDSFDSLKELEDGSPIIVKGIKVEEKGTDIYRSKIDGEIAGGYTKSDFKVTEVYKNTDNNSKIKINNTITISESAFYDDETKTTYSINGYENMIKGEEYLLFLTNETEGLFSPRGVIFGKVPLNTDELEVYEDEDSLGSYSTDVLDGIFTEARTNYDD